MLFYDSVPELRTLAFESLNKFQSFPNDQAEFRLKAMSSLYLDLRFLAFKMLSKNVMSKKKNSEKMEENF